MEVGCNQLTAQGQPMSSQSMLTLMLPSFCPADISCVDIVFLYRYKLTADSV